MIEARQYHYVAMIACFIWLIGFPSQSLHFLMLGMIIFEEDDWEDAEGEGELVDVDIWQIPYIEYDWSDFRRSTLKYAKIFNCSFTREIGCNFYDFDFRKSKMMKS